MQFDRIISVRNNRTVFRDGYDLLVESFLLIDAIEDALELIEQVE